MKLLLFALIALFFPLQAQAEDILVSMSDIPASSEKKVSSKSYKKEAKDFEKLCRDDLEMPLYFKCGCLADEYLEHRKDLGPEAHSSAVRNRLGAHCKDGSGIAAKMEKNCLNEPNYAPKGKDIKVFCECYAEGFRKLFETTPGKLTNRLKLSFLSKSRLKCSDPAAYKKIYGH